MRRTPKQYAQALFEAVSGKKDGEIGGIVKKFAEVMIADNQVSNFERILWYFNEIWNKHWGIAEAEITSADKPDSETVSFLRDFIAGLSGRREVVLKQRVDKDILGGVVIRYGDRVLDGSLRTRLRELREKMVR